MGKNPRRGSTLDSVLEQEGIPPLPEVRTTRRAVDIPGFDADASRAPSAADFSHIDPELNKLMD